MSSRRPTGSVLVPAHNESAVIGRCLHYLFEAIDADLAALEVVVVCNGCGDATAAVARATGHPVPVIELAVASKPAALRAGDRLLRTFPRIYLDADVTPPGPAARRVLKHPARDGSVAARPPFRYETTHASAMVRRYYRARSQVPAVFGSIWAAGVYELSEVGRARFADYPDVVGDEPVVVTAPAYYCDLHKVIRRAYRGAAETQVVTEGSATRTTSPRSTTPATLRGVVRLCRSLSGSVNAATHAFVAISARADFALPRWARWEQDESSRTLTATTQDAGTAS